MTFLQCLEKLHVSSCAERPPGAGEQHRPCVRIGSKKSPDTSESPVEVRVGRIECIRAVQDDDPNGAALLDAEHSREGILHSSALLGYSAPPRSRASWRIT